MDTSFHYLLMANQAMIHKLLFSGLQGTEMTIGQPKILDFLKDNNGVNQKEIARGCHIEPSSLTSLLNRMEESNLIERKNLNGNRRSYYIFMTEKGKEYQELVSARFSELEQKAFQGVAKEEAEQFGKTFLKVYHNLKGE